MGASGAATVKTAPPVDPPRMPRMTAWPGTMKTQTYRRETARDLSLPGFLRSRQGLMEELSGFWGPDLSHLRGWRGQVHRYCRHRRDGGGCGPVRRTAGGSAGLF